MTSGRSPLKKWHTLTRAERRFSGAKGDGVFAAEKAGVDSPVLAGFQGALRFGWAEPRLANRAVTPTLARCQKSALQKPNCGTNSDLSRRKHRPVELIAGSQQIDNKKPQVK